MNPIMDALGQVGYALDTPGAYLRGALAGNLGQRASGRDLLSTYGLTDESDPLGGLKGFGAEMVLDPLALAGPALGAYKGITGATRGAKALSHADDANPLIRGLAGFIGDEEGALRPFQEIGQRTDPDVINALPWYHGSGTPGLTPEVLDPMKTSPTNLFGRGIYKTASPEIASEYAATRTGDGLRDWDRDAFGAVSDAARDNPEMAQRIVASFGDLLNDPAFMGGDPAKLKYLRETSDPWLRRGVPGHYIRTFMNNMGSNENEVRMVAERLGGLGVRIPTLPSEQIYQASTNLGKILDLDEAAPPSLIDRLSDFSEELAEHADWTQRQPYDVLGDMLDQDVVSSADLIEAMRPEAFNVPRDTPDLLSIALRELGYDALSHTGGLRAGGGRNLHQVLISLDPNDTISNVGRAGQITRFDPQNIEQLLRQFRGG